MIYAHLAMNILFLKPWFEINKQVQSLRTLSSSLNGHEQHFPVDFERIAQITRISTSTASYVVDCCNTAPKQPSTLLVQM